MKLDNIKVIVEFSEQYPDPLNQGEVVRYSNTSVIETVNSIDEIPEVGTETFCSIPTRGNIEVRINRTEIHVSEYDAKAFVFVTPVPMPKFS